MQTTVTKRFVNQNKLEKRLRRQVGQAIQIADELILMLLGIRSGLDTVDDEDLSGVIWIDWHRELSNILYGSDDLDRP